MSIGRLTSHIFVFGVFLAGSASADNPDWRTHLSNQLPLLGHRNFIVVADSAYPLQSSQSIETIYADDTQLTVVREVLNAVSAADHVRAVVHLDRELDFVPEKQTPGIDSYRADLARLLDGVNVNKDKHIDIIKRLDETSTLFRVLIIKTDLTLPYTSVFIELDAAYWSGEAETALRSTMSDE